MHRFPEAPTVDEHMNLSIHLRMVLGGIHRDSLSFVVRKKNEKKTKQNENGFSGKNEKKNEKKTKKTKIFWGRGEKNSHFGAEGAGEKIF